MRSQGGPFLGGLQYIQAYCIGECRGRGNPFVEVEVEVTTFGARRVCRPGGRGSGIGYMIRAAAGLTKHGFWDAGKGVWVQLNIPLTPLNGKVVRGAWAKFHTIQILCHTGELSG